MSYAEYLLPPITAILIYLGVVFLWLPLYRQRQRYAQYIPISLPSLSSTGRGNSGSDSSSSNNNSNGSNGLGGWRERLGFWLSSPMMAMRMEMGRIIRPHEWQQQHHEYSHSQHEQSGSWRPGSIDSFEEGEDAPVELQSGGNISSIRSHSLNATDSTSADQESRIIADRLFRELGLEELRDYSPQR